MSRRTGRGSLHNPMIAHNQRVTNHRSRMFGGNLELAGLKQEAVRLLADRVAGILRRDAEALEWLSSDATGPGSLTNLADVIGRPEALLREQIAKLRHSPTPMKRGALLALGDI